jgi:hypothetical protein
MSGAFYLIFKSKLFFVSFFIFKTVPIKMSVKRPVNNTIFCSNKKIRKSVILQVKLDVLKRFDAGECASEIASVLSLPDSTVRTIKINEKKNCETALNVVIMC